MNKIAVVDANLIFSCLISESPRILRGFLLENFSFVAPNFVIVELFKHFERIKKGSHLSDDEMFELLSEIVGRIRFYDETLISVGNWIEASRLCREIDPKDTAYVALALELNAKFWTNDNALKTGLIKKGFDNFYEP